jgi:DNA-binding CsgD family transcriptional regulator/PAS domain-containing protein
MDITAKKLSHLLEGLYEASVAPELWRTALQRIANAVGGSTSGLVVQNQATGGFPLAATDWRAPEEGLQAYFDHYGQHDELREHANHRIGEVLTDQQLVTPQIACTETYNDFYVRFGLSRSIGYVWHPGADELASVVVYKSGEDGAFSAADAELVSFLVPHLERAVRISSALGQAAAEASGWRGMLDRFSSSVILVNREGRVIASNSSAASMLSRADGLVVAKGELRGSQSRETTALRRLVAITASQEPQSCPGEIEISRPSGKSPLLISAAPHRIAGGERGVLLIVTDPAAMPEHLHGHLRRRFGMTESEATIAVRLSAGASLPEIAEERGSSLHTVRTQVKQVLQKAGARTQADLVRTILRDPAMSLLQSPI